MMWILVKRHPVNHKWKFKAIILLKKKAKKKKRLHSQKFTGATYLQRGLTVAQ